MLHQFPVASTVQSLWHLPYTYKFYKSEQVITANGGVYGIAVTSWRYVAANHIRLKNGYRRVDTRSGYPSWTHLCNFV